MIAYFKENGKLYFGKVGFISYLKTFFSKHGKLIKLKSIKGYENYSYYSDYVLMPINSLTFCTEYEKDWDILERIEFTESVKL